MSVPIEDSRPPDTIPEGAGRSFPVPRRPAAEEYRTEHAGLAEWQRRVLWALLGISVVAVLTGAWLILRPGEKRAAAAAVVAAPARTVSPDAAVEIYFTPSQPESVPPLEEDFPPLPVAPVSLESLFGDDGK